MTTKKLSQIRSPSWWSALILIILAAGIAFSPGLKAGFLSMDDPVTILENPDLQAFDRDHFRRIITRPVQNVYIPLTALSLWVEYSLAGPAPGVLDRKSVV